MIWISVIFGLAALLGGVVLFRRTTMIRRQRSASRNVAKWLLQIENPNTHRTVCRCPVCQQSRQQSENTQRAA